MVLFVRHRQIDDAEHHEDKRLQGDDQDVEYSPRPLQHHAQAAEPEQAAAEHDSDQDEHQLASVHVAEQTQCQRDRFGNQRHEFKQEVHRNQQSLNENVLAAERVKGQFADVEVKLESPADMRRLLEALARGVLLGAVRPQQASAITGIVNSAAKIAEIETELALLAELERERSR